MWWSCIVKGEPAMYLSYFVHKVTFKSDLRCFRFLRWTILVPLVIYLSLLFFKYNRNVPLRSLTSTTAVQDNKGLMIENLLIELEAVTADKRDLEHYKEIDKNIKDVEVAENQGNLKTLLENIFQRADTDQDQLLDIQELARWIHTKIIEHISRAMKENVGLFTAIDNNPRNGEISWEEYHAHFLRSHGFPESYVSSHDKKHSNMSRTLKESIMRDRARWAEAAKNDPERLTLDEFLAFTHPESSHRALLQMVEDLFEKFDRDGDEQLTEDEFSDLPSEGMGLDLKEDKREAVGGSDDRRKEFRHLIDKNKNGKADRTELLMYVDPRNPRHAIQEAQYLIGLSDTNLDEKLNLFEILSKIDLFLGSKMVDTERSFHDEF
ncbi:stromal cell derived factor mayday isoform X1 [Bombus vancouverensis nearcticus]|uniref:45 kDa calcium-binding protein n=1 Tax=Bombus bifarius TaxID=103933 RepID=A0A6P8NPV5_9HYME|nr:45 kDa calcium-binding protein [Bombus vancouverensis nearcticus]XP_033316357.1 45 kDa calcium-binding protein [Bombus bifarius]